MNEKCYVFHEARQEKETIIDDSNYSLQSKSLIRKLMRSLTVWCSMVYGGLVESWTLFWRKIVVNAVIVTGARCEIFIDTGDTGRAEICRASSFNMITPHQADNENSIFFTGFWLENNFSKM